MEIRLTRGYPIKESEKKVLQVLQAARSWPDDAEIISRTGLEPWQVRNALHIIRQQMRLHQSQQKLKMYQHASTL